MSLPDDLISPKTAAKILRSHISTVYRLIHSGKLRSFRRAGTRHLVSRADVEALLVEETPAPRLETSADVARRRKEAIDRLRQAGLRF
jgi:excisionase family DNA binding protein